MVEGRPQDRQAPPEHDVGPEAYHGAGPEGVEGRLELALDGVVGHLGEEIGQGRAEQVAEAVVLRAQPAAFERALDQQAQLVGSLVRAVGQLPLQLPIHRVAQVAPQAQLG